MKNSKNKKLFTYIVVGALVMALSISCKNNDKTGSSGYSVPKATGYKATDLVNAEYFGTLKRTAHEGSDNGYTSMEFQLFIEKNKVGSGRELGAFAGADFTGTQMYKSDS